MSKHILLFKFFFRRTYLYTTDIHFYGKKDSSLTKLSVYKKKATRNVYFYFVVFPMCCVKIFFVCNIYILHMFLDIDVCRYKNNLKLKVKPEHSLSIMG